MSILLAYYNWKLETVKGKNPVWNKLNVMEVELNKKLEFAENIIVTVKNVNKRTWGVPGSKDNEIFG